MPTRVPGHREERQARTIQEARDMRGNNLSDSLASMGSGLPLTPYTPDAPRGIGVGGTEAPTPAKKWITTMRPHATPEGVHWATHTIWVLGGVAPKGSRAQLAYAFFPPQQLKNGCPSPLFKVPC